MLQLISSFGAPATPSPNPSLYFAPNTDPPYVIDPTALAVPSLPRHPLIPLYIVGPSPSTIIPLSHLPLLSQPQPKPKPICRSLGCYQCCRNK
uniref:Uncharacterized protein n=1 Tax=Oryza nivara TaxID=4536 RepID=A0A0E0GKD6_ORYNI